MNKKNSFMVLGLISFCFQAVVAAPRPMGPRSTNNSTVQGRGMVAGPKQNLEKPVFVVAKNGSFRQMRKVVKNQNNGQSR